MDREDADVHSIFNFRFRVNTKETAAVSIVEDYVNNTCGKSEAFI